MKECRTVGYSGDLVEGAIHNGRGETTITKEIGRLRCPRVERLIWGAEAAETETETIRVRDGKRQGGNMVGNL